MPSTPTRKLRTTKSNVHLEAIIISSDQLRHLYESVKLSGLFQDVDKTSIFKDFYMATFEDDNPKIFHSIDDLVKYPNIDSAKIKTLICAYGSTSPYVRLYINFGRDSNVKMVIKSEIRLDNDRFALNSIRQQIESFDPEYPWFVRAAIMRRTLLKFASLGLLVSLSVVFIYTAMFIYGKIKGIDVDPSLLPGDIYNYLPMAAKAIKSSDLSEKLNVILMKNFTEFENVSTLFPKFKKYILIGISGVAVFTSTILLIKRLRTLYPTNWYAIGKQAEKLNQMINKREFWIVTILVGFFINVLAGIALLIFG